MLLDHLPLRAVTLTTALLCACTSSVALAQDASEEPFRVDFIDVSKSKQKSAQVTDALVAIFDDAEEFDIKEGEFLESAFKRGLEPSNLRSEKQRAASSVRIASAIKASKLDALLLVDTYDRGRRLQFIILGPNGNKIHESRARLEEASTLSDDEAQRIFYQALAEVLPILSDYRALQEEERDLSVRPKFTKRVRRGETNGPLANKLVAEGGVYIGQRTLELRPALQDNPGLRQSILLVGPNIRVAGAKAFKNDQLHLGGDIDFAWSPFNLSYIKTGDTEPTTLDAGFLRLDAIGRVAQGLNDSITLGLQLGFGLNRTTVDANEFYNGNSYVWGRVGVELILLVVPGSSFTLTASALPVVNANISDAGFGEPESTLGSELGAELRFEITKDLDFTARFRHSRVNLNYLTGEPTTIPTTKDTINAGTIGLGYVF